MTQELKDRLCLAWERLNYGEWDAELLGEPPEGVSQAEARRNAMIGIENIVGFANILYYSHMRNGNLSEKEWLRWYLVDQCARPEVLRERKVRKRILAVIAAVLTAIALAAAAHVAQWL